MHETTQTTDLSNTSRTNAPAEASSNGTGVHQQPLSDRMAQSAHHTIDRLADSAGPHIERMAEAVADTTGKLIDHAGHVRDKGDEWAVDLRVAIRRNPVSAVAVAMAIGAVIARITR